MNPLPLSPAKPLRERSPLENAMFLAQDGKCFHCGSGMAKRRFTPRRHRWVWTKEHIIAKANGGPESWSNAVMAHQHCNQERGIRALSNDELARVREIHRTADELMAIWRLPLNNRPFLRAQESP
jgi:5-methylcytosine-specific restriction endonuclease McrA